ncbi:MAG: glycosyltransferase [Planctomycetales bacterium]
MNASSPADPRVSIAFCITELEVGGAERCLTELAIGLPRDRFQPTVYSLASRPTDDQAELVRRLENRGIPVEFLNARSQLSFPVVVGKLVARLRRNRPRILHSFLYHANVVGAVAGKLAGVPRIASGIRVADGQSRFRLWLERTTSRFVHRHACVSESVADFCKRRISLAPERLEVIPNSVDISRFAEAKPIDPAKLGISSSRRFVVCVGRLDHQKGADVLVRHAGDWLSQTPEHDLLMVGKGPCLQALRRQVDASSLADRIHFVGWRSEIPEILAASDVLVLPSQWEGMPNVILEAMAAGKPVVVNDVEGVREAVGPLDESQVIDPKDHAAFSQAVATFCCNPDLARDRGKKNQQRIAENFTVSVMIQRYLEFYDRLLAC